MPLCVRCYSIFHLFLFFFLFYFPACVFVKSTKTFCSWNTFLNLLKIKWSLIKSLALVCNKISPVCCESTERFAHVSDAGEKYLGLDIGLIRKEFLLDHLKNTVAQAKEDKKRLWFSFLLSPCFSRCASCTPSIYFAVKKSAHVNLL